MGQGALSKPVVQWWLSLNSSMGQGESSKSAVQWWLSLNSSIREMKHGQAPRAIFGVVWWIWRLGKAIRVVLEGSPWRFLMARAIIFFAPCQLPSSSHASVAQTATRPSSQGPA